jgi:hypothetical protein
MKLCGFLKNVVIIILPSFYYKVQNQRVDQAAFPW